MNKLNREQIIKALECCTRQDCDRCPLDRPNPDCLVTLPQNALDLIKELIEERDRCLKALSVLSDNIGLLKDKAKADAVQKMHEKLKAELNEHYSLYFRVLSGELIDQIAKEMLEENNG